jgi:hypothetical protein
MFSLRRVKKNATPRTWPTCCGWVGCRRRGSPLWVPETRVRSCDLLILVDEAAETVASFDLVELGSCAAGEWAGWSSLPQGAVWPVTVVVALELA